MYVFIANRFYIYIILNGFERFFFNSIVVTFGAIIISTVFAAMAAYAVSRMIWRNSGRTLVVFLSGMMIPMHAVLVPLLIIMTRTNLYDTYWALILPYAAFALPMAVYVFAGFFGTLPRELEEAACIDGYNIYGVFMKVMLPLIRPAVATVAIFTYLSCWNELMFAISFIKEIRVANIELAAYFVISAEGMSIKRIGILFKTNA